MKKVTLLIVIVSIGLSARGFAAQADACPQFIPCGTYLGSGDDQDGSSGVARPYLERIVIAGQGADAVLIEDDVYSEGQTPGQAGTYVLKLELDFQPDGRFVTKNSSFTGYCGNGSCSIAIDPWTNADKSVSASVNVLRFNDDSLTREMITLISSHPSVYQHSKLKKQ